MGVGVFATHFLAKGTPVLTGEFTPRYMKIKDVPEAQRKYCILLSDEDCRCPQRFDRMEIGWYLNHSFEANVRHVKEDDTVVTTRDIEAGEEILIDYNGLGEPEHLKEDYYR